MGKLRGKLLGVWMLALLLAFSLRHAEGQVKAADSSRLVVAVDIQNMPLSKALRLVASRAGLGLDLEKGLELDRAAVYYATMGAPVTEILYSLLHPRGLQFSVNGKEVQVFKEQVPGHIAPLGDVKRAVDSLPLMKTETALRGLVLEGEGTPVEDATVRIIGNGAFAISDGEGRFMLSSIPKGAVLSISRVGYQPVEISYLELQGPVIELKPVPNGGNLSDVTVNTGLFTRNKNTFTGAVSSYTADQLRSVGMQNLVQSLKSLDPAFVQIANRAEGANPNTLPNVQIRGGSSAAAIHSSTLNSRFQNDPNLPLFILDGIEATLRQITDIDINRIAKVTILKDAASTVLYGNKAANGVLVVETVRPLPGRLRVNYSFSGAYQWPDLGSYNFMNARQLFEFQEKAGVFYSDGVDPNLINFQPVMGVVDSLYNTWRYKALHGASNDWLRVPLRAAFSPAHSLSINGGDESLQYTVHLNYKTDQGIMKGSERNSYGAGIDLQYSRKGLKVINSFSFNGYKANNSPYGNFADYVYMNPLFDIFDNAGSLNTSRYLFDLRPVLPAQYQSWLNSPLSQVQENPLYNASLPSFSFEKQLELIDNLNVLYDLSPDLRLSAGLGITVDRTDVEDFVDPRNTMFDNMATTLKGRFDEAWVNENSYQGSLALSYHKVFDRHSLNANLRTGLDYTKGRYTAMAAVGFPSGPSFSLASAFAYAPSAGPGFYESLQTNMQNVFSLNYAFAQKYLFDFSFNKDGSSSFGSEKLFKNFTSVGLGYNLTEEKALHLDKEKVSLLRLTANIGSSGNQNLGTYVSSSVYGLKNGSNPFGLAYMLRSLGTPSLDWQTTRQVSLGLNFDLFKHFLSGYVNLYHKLTRPLIIGASLPPSSGIQQSPLNVGSLAIKGLEFELDLRPFYKPWKNLSWTFGITGGLSKGKYQDIGDKLSYQNNANVEAGIGDDTYYEDLQPSLVDEATLLQYRDGNDPNGLWVVRSLGIDPATGRELFLNKNGKATFEYNPADAVNIGSMLPALQGVISNTLQIKRFSFSAYLRYSLNQMAINYGLYNYAERINYSRLLYNQDQRAMRRWFKPGDRAPFASIESALNSAYYPLSSRFVSKESFLSGESISIGYQLTKADSKLLEWLHASSLRLTVYMNDIFYLSNVKLERGINYPYQKRLSFSAALGF